MSGLVSLIQESDCTTGHVADEVDVALSFFELETLRESSPAPRSTLVD